MNSVHIPPTVGRVVWYWPGERSMLRNELEKLGQPESPLAAIIAFVNTDGTVNLSVHDAYGNVAARRQVTLIQGDMVRAKGVEYCTWMPYQLGQARATAAAEEAQRNLAAFHTGTSGEQPLGSVGDYPKESAAQGEQRGPGAAP